MAIVDEDIILSSEVRDRVQQVQATLEQRGMAVPEMSILMSETLDRLILESIQLQLAERYGIKIPDAQLDQALQRMAAQNGMNMSQFRDTLQANGQSYIQMREAIRDELAIQRVQQGSVMRDIAITDREIENFMTTEEGKELMQPEYRVIQALLSVSKNDNVSQRKKKEDFVNDLLASILSGTPFIEAVQKTDPFGFSGGDLGWRKESEIPRQFVDLVKTLKPGQTGKVSSSSGFHLVYLAEARGIERLVQQTNVRHILVKPNEVLDDDAAREFIASLKQRIESGEDFAELAKEHSDDIGSAQEGGELGWTNPGQMVPEFETAMAGAEIGSVTDPVRSEFGWHNRSY